MYYARDSGVISGILMFERDKLQEFFNALASVLA